MVGATSRNASQLLCLMIMYKCPLDLVSQTQGCPAQLEQSPTRAVSPPCEVSGTYSLITNAASQPFFLLPTFPTRRHREQHSVITTSNQHTPKPPQGKHQHIAMSDIKTSRFTAREFVMLAKALQCHKGGPLEVCHLCAKRTRPPSPSEWSTFWGLILCSFNPSID